MKNELDVRDYHDLSRSFISASEIITKNYLAKLESYAIAELPNELGIIEEVCKFTRLFKISKLVYNKDEHFLDKLSTILNGLYTIKSTVITIITSDGFNVDLYLGTVNKTELQDTSNMGKFLNGSFCGNLPGSEMQNIDAEEMAVLLENIFVDCSVVSAVSGIPSLRNKEEQNNITFTQGIENMVDSLAGIKYTLLTIADSVEPEQLNQCENSLENLYSQIFPFSKSELNFNESEGLSLTDSTSNSVSKAINTSVSDTQNSTISKGWSKAHTEGESLTGTATAGFFVGVAGGVAVSKGKNTSDTLSETGNTSDSFGVTYNSGVSDVIADITGFSSGTTETKGRSLQISMINKKADNMLKNIDLQIERLNLCESYGAFNYATYVITNELGDNERVASAYNALLKGDASYLQTAQINTWNKNKSRAVLNYLKRFTHPNFSESYLTDTYVSPASLISAEELALSIGLPKKSITGLPVIECVPFGRNIQRLSEVPELEQTIKLGKVHHMGKTSDNTTIQLDLNSLGMHTFITGSTGSGKSNTVYCMLNKLKKNDIHFLVIEPAKGEYKHVFGNKENVNVYGTNPKIMPLLKINPFKFPKEIHVLEHIDKLIEIFNVCWPMYAAMPAVLKESVERAYVAAGWDLDLSENETAEALFPTFADVLLELNQVIGESAYSEELKGNYIGSLATRIKSLTNGINGRIFGCDEIDNQLLFDSNTIVDLSRVGSMETKALVMGILVMRLQEHRMAQGGMNADLKHVTVLEEAHHLLKRTSTEQSSEGSNLLGKSVEMLANSIAEMRTYGEGFIIADQSPGLMDMSVIRNTNTKIILRLPDYSDRELVGKAASLNDDQIKELAKLQTGVAAVYQNDWLEPVLCKVNKHLTLSNKQYVLEEQLQRDGLNEKKLKTEIIKFLVHGRISEKIEPDLDYIDQYLINSNLAASHKRLIKQLIGEFIDAGSLEIWTTEKFGELSRCVSQVLDSDLHVGKGIMESSDYQELTKMMIDLIKHRIDECNEQVLLETCHCMLRNIIRNHETELAIYAEWRNQVENGEMRL
ncbi:DUF87 domain-containing protein [Acetobacterium wieringae]|uniref:DUF87 domain-containing protein n=1 Tax=Acetobacterium wieringae TaxID=52694 RepID=A0A5D0WQW3_9FIRM|nr:DUF87 domain-containing protein [Acetobacterium wieringae]TYC86549.1 DUF87 domain-containing protein [Acetobacterium wieringae]